MEFKNFNAFAYNLSPDNLTASTALCALEAVVRDILSVPCVLPSEKRFSLLPPGNITELSQKILYFSRMLNQIFVANEDQFQAFPGQLNGQLDTMLTNAETLERNTKEIEQKLSEIAGAEARLRQAKKRSTELDADLTRAQAAQAEYEALVPKIQDAEKQIAVCSQFDPEQAKKKLTKLEAQLQTLQAENDSLLQSIQNAEASLKTAEQTKEALEKQKKEAPQQLAELIEACDKLQEEIASTESTILATQSILDELSSDKQREVRALEELRKANDTIEAEIERETAHYRELIQKQTELTQKTQALTVEIGEADRSNEALRSKLREKESQLCEKQETAADLKKQHAKLIEQLSTVQDQIETLKTQNIPAAQGLLEDAVERKARFDTELAELSQQLQTCNTEIDETESQIDKTHKHLAPLEEKLSKMHTEYATLTAVVGTRQKEIEELDKKIAELQATAESDRIPVLIAQKQQQIEDLQNAEQERRKLEAELPVKEAEIASLQRQITELHEKIRQYERNLETEKQRLLELKPYLSDDMQTRIRTTAERVSQLESVRSSLNTTIAQIRSKINGNVLLKQSSDVDVLGEILRELSDYIKKLSDDLTAAARCCADELKV